jgi:outer membrane receptor for ferrienterochelin and colicins
MPNSISPFRLAILPFSLLAAFGAHVNAQQIPTAEPAKTGQTQTTPVKPANVVKPAAEKIQKVEVSGVKGYDERRQDTASKIVVTQEDIVRYGDTNIGDVLKRLPGVTIGGVQGRGGAIRMRGLGAGYTQIMLNGEPSPPGFSLDSISPDNIERIEVIRSATAELSTQSIAGAINIVLKRAIVTAQRELKVGMQEDGGKYGANVSLQFSDKLGRMSYSISGNANQGKFDRNSSSDEIGRDSSGNIISNQHIDANDWGTFTGLGLAPRVNWNLENGDTVTSQSFINANQFSGFNQQKSTGSLPLYVSEFSEIDSQFVMLRSNLNWVRKLADSAKLDVKLGVNYNKRESDVAFQGYDKNGLKLLDRKAIAAASDQGFTYGGKYTAPFVTDHSIAAGWDGAFSKRNETRQQNDVTVAPIAPINLNEIFDAEVNRLAIFVQDEWNMSKNWSIYAGLRWEGIETKSEGNTYAQVKNSSSVWSPILQTLWKIPGSKNDQVRLGLTRTYKAPDTSSLIPRRFISNNNSATSPDRIGNPNLRPELAWGLDAAFEHYLTDGGVLSASVFVRRIEDITRTGLAEVRGRWVAMPINDGLATTRGIELDAKFPLRSFIADGPAIDFRTNLSFNWSNLSTVPGPNNRLDSQTPISANVGVDYKLDPMPLTIGGNFSFQNGGPVRISVEQSSYSIPKRVLDLYALWKFDTKTNLRVSIGNGLHQDNVSSNTYTDVNGSLSRISTTPTTVTFRAMLEHKF